MSYHILCVDDDAEFLLHLKIQLKQNFQVTTTQTLKEGYDTLLKGSVDLVLLDVGLKDESGIEGLREIKSHFSSVDVVMVSGHKDPQMIVKAIRMGASDYLCKPCDKDELFAVIEKMQNLKGLRERNEALLVDMNTNQHSSKMIGDSKVFKDLLTRVACIKGYNANVLLEGESGTGKELVARYVHTLEEDPKRPFIVVNCAAIPDNLIESELFGHEKGSFTGASRRKIGKFELANGGDIFLDEINSLKTELQAKILRVIQEQEIYRVGGTKPVKITFRVVAATNVDLEDSVAKGTFRMDLYHRLRVLSFKIPALRDRIEDIPVLINSFVEKFCKDKHKKQITPDAIEVFKKYEWPGNVRELENLIHSLIIMTPKQKISVSDLPGFLIKEIKKETLVHINHSQMPSDVRHVVPLKKYIQSAEVNYIKHALELNNGDKSKLAKVLGISRSCLYDKISQSH